MFRKQTVFVQPKGNKLWLRNPKSEVFTPNTAQPSTAPTDDTAATMGTYFGTCQYDTKIDEIHNQ